MGDALIVSGGGTTAVATDELFADAARLGGTEATLADWRDRLRVIEVGVHQLDLAEPTASPHADQSSPNWGIALARQCLRFAEGDATSLRDSLMASAERYGLAERTVDALWRLGGTQLAWVVGATWPWWILGAITIGAAWSGAHALGWRSPLEDWVAGIRQLLSDPAFVRAVRSAADSIDESLLGALHLPGDPAISLAIGAGIHAPALASMLLGATGRLGAVTGSRVLVDGPVHVKRTADRPTEVAAPTGIADLADRIPQSDDAAQVRVERYGTESDPRWVVYIGGTVDFTMTAGAQTNDMTSNLYGIADDSPIDEQRVAGADSAAVERAVRQALAEAGMQPGDPLIPIGHSGGGIVAATLAGDPELNVVAAVNLGGPVASAELREGVPLLSVEHEEDLVPATGGWGHPSPDRLTVSRSVLEAGGEYDDVLPAHLLVRYQETAALIDASEEQRLVEFRETVAEFTGGSTGATGEMSEWVATRDVRPSTTGAARGR
ncbi:hypothetical protein ACWGST_07465 [Agromyces sp. NPDC055520]